MSDATGPRDAFPTVCIVDDDPSVGRALTRLLRRHNFRAEAFSRPNDFLHKMQSPDARCDALLLDINLGTTTGFALHDQLTTLGLVVPTIFMTAYPRRQTPEQVFRVGGKAYLIKPFGDGALVAAVRMVLPRIGLDGTGPA